MDAESLPRAADVRTPRGDGLPPVAGRAISLGELRALFAVCAADKNQHAGIRDACAIALHYGCGLRRSELVGLSLGDYNAEAGQFNVRGNGNKTRLAYVQGGAERAMANWLAVRQLVTATPTSQLLLPVLKSRRVILAGSPDQTVLDMFRRRAGQDHVPPFSPHDFRRTVNGDLLDVGADITTAQQLAGHASVTTTARYDRRGERATRTASGLLHVPDSDDRV